MPRSSAQSFINSAVFGRCSQTWMPGTAVAIGLKALVLLSGFGSNVSMWLAPPTMNSRMQLLCLGEPTTDCSAARAARVPSQPDAGTPRAPAAVRRSQSRRERLGVIIANLRVVSAGETVSD
jgi:hypothetical protein